MEHGTVEMYRKELRTSTLSVCDACRKAQAQAIREHRGSKPPRDRTAETRAATIRRRALNRLANENQDRLAALIAEESAR